jgi:hypothetical protein
LQQLLAQQQLQKQQQLQLQQQLQQQQQQQQQQQGQLSPRSGGFSYNGGGGGGGVPSPGKTISTLLGSHSPQGMGSHNLIAGGLGSTQNLQPAPTLDPNYSRVQHPGMRSSPVPMLGTAAAMLSSQPPNGSPVGAVGAGRMSMNGLPLGSVSGLGLNLSSMGDLQSGSLSPSTGMGSPTAAGLGGSRSFGGGAATAMYENATFVAGPNNPVLGGPGLGGPGGLGRGQGQPMGTRMRPTAAMVGAGGVGQVGNGNGAPMAMMPGMMDGMTVSQMRQSSSPVMMLAQQAKLQQPFDSPQQVQGGSGGGVSGGGGGGGGGGLIRLGPQVPFGHSLSSQQLQAHQYVGPHLQQQQQQRQQELRANMRWENDSGRSRSAPMIHLMQQQQQQQQLQQQQQQPQVGHLPTQMQMQQMQMQMQPPQPHMPMLQPQPLSQPQSQQSQYQMPMQMAHQGSSFSGKTSTLLPTEDRDRDMNRSPSPPRYVDNSLELSAGARPFVPKFSVVPPAPPPGPAPASASSAGSSTANNATSIPLGGIGSNTWGPQIGSASSGGGNGSTANGGAFRGIGSSSGDPLGGIRSASSADPWGSMLSGPLAPPSATPPLTAFGPSLPLPPMPMPPLRSSSGPLPSLSPVLTGSGPGSLRGSHEMQFSRLGGVLGSGASPSPLSMPPSISSSSTTSTSMSLGMSSMLPAFPMSNTSDSFSESMLSGLLGPKQVSGGGMLLHSDSNNSSMISGIAPTLTLSNPLNRYNMSSSSDMGLADMSMQGSGHHGFGPGGPLSNNNIATASGSANGSHHR